MRDWPNPVFDGSLEEACDSLEPVPYVEKIGFEVEGLDALAGTRYVLLPTYDPGLAPWTGETTRCSSISFEGLFRVVRVAKGFPGAMTLGRYPEDFPEGRR